MTTAIDDVVDAIRFAGYHNHRQEGHSGLLSRGILRDVSGVCDPFREDLQSGVIRDWLDCPRPEGRHPGRQRKLDLVVTEPAADATVADLALLRFCVENKSVVTAHRNRTNRFDDLSDLVGVLHRTKPEAVLVATVLIGVAKRVLNVPDCLKRLVDQHSFEEQLRPRLSRGDQALWDEYPRCISRNRASDPELTVELFRRLPTRPPARTDIVGFDFVLLIPVHVDNVDPPVVARANNLGIDVDREYQRMLTAICRAYTARWHV